jgi:hypothetical protein
MLSVAFVQRCRPLLPQINFALLAKFSILRVAHRWVKEGSVPSHRAKQDGLGGLVGYRGQPNALDIERRGHRWHEMALVLGNANKL